MIAVADGPSRRNRTEAARWGGSLLFVLLLHVAAGLYLLPRHVPLDAGGPPPAAVIVDLAPPSAPTPPAPPEPAAQPQPQAVPAPPPPPQPVIRAPKVEQSPAPHPAVALPVKPPPQRRRKPAKRRVEIAPELPPPAAAATAAAPLPLTTAPPAVDAGAARASWQARLVGWLERYKRYPRLAQEERQEGVVRLRFTMDRQGRVLAAQIEQSSGFALLDQEVSALIERAQPLPAPPPEVRGEEITLSLPVQFFLRSGKR